MSKICNKYLKLKERNNDLYYLFKVGNFYIFLDEDATRVSELTGLKLTKFTDTISKCGFPLISKEKYFNILGELNINYQVIEDLYTSKTIINMIKNLDIEKLDLNDSYNLLSKFHYSLNNE